jgi:hypothetical protein
MPRQPHKICGSGIAHRLSQTCQILIRSPLASVHWRDSRTGSCDEVSCSFSQSPSYSFHAECRISGCGDIKYTSNFEPFYDFNTQNVQPITDPRSPGKWWVQTLRHPKSASWRYVGGYPNPDRLVPWPKEIPPQKTCGRLPYHFRRRQRATASAVDGRVDPRLEPVQQPIVKETVRNNNTLELGA